MEASGQTMQVCGSYLEFQKLAEVYGCMLKLVEVMKVGGLLWRSTTNSMSTVNRGTKATLFLREYSPHFAVVTKAGRDDVQQYFDCMGNKIWGTSPAIRTGRIRGDLVSIVQP